ncbi:hypothetical protein SAMN02745116_01291 [Pilibacter termitis]|uniref:Modulator of FtsH protease n=1 Tax=Pilibacter termitis TaxID=263852 RepID=A0A1T4N246_9ENTE|nr:Bax inhibitor-1/YccA family protein [Pilibacter termitis]SJZ73186.1 hypothetical protein SAMN02745116_01291 [Pilibacter termitis]
MMNEVTQAWTLQKFFGRIYSVMAMGVGISAIVAYMTIAFFPENLMNLGGGPLIAIWLVEMILVMALSRSAMKNTAFALPGFLLFSAVNGFVISYSLAFYQGTIVAQAFITAAALFAGMAVIGVRTSKDLTGMGQAMFAALWGVIVAGIIGIFFPNGVMGLLLSLASVVIFSGLIAYDNQRIKSIYEQNNGLVSDGWAISMGLSLYLDFINLFLSILRIFGFLSRD